MEWIIPFLVGAFAGGLAVVLAIRFSTGLVGETDDRDEDAVDQARVDALVYGVGYLRKRPDGRLESVSPKLFLEDPRR